MPMKRLLIVVALLATAADKTPVVTKLLRPMISLYDENGTLMERVEKWTLPTGGAPIKGRNAMRQVGIMKDGNIVYLRNSEIETANETSRCLQASEASRDANRHTAASGGVHSGMSGDSSICVAEDGGQ